jgi:hypothetical protein
VVFGDMDMNGCFEADLNGVRGLVPGLYVEEVEDGHSHSTPNGTTDQEKRRNGNRPFTNGNCEVNNPLSLASMFSDLYKLYYILQQRKLSITVIHM